ncbi:hypothetical protein Acr_23g0018850 [Actinidia rufa]|uniref:MORF/ORRM1/DAG-like MORF domain-containing protein n=1 Tax=Actinidia rufa TaxID=165716 RepID=A0A7J0GRR4_9ERIC|nr:hypothetical protein Acr_23g0018850 [Actinidia rufa]
MATTAAATMARSILTVRSSPSLLIPLRFQTPLLLHNSIPTSSRVPPAGQGGPVRKVELLAAQLGLELQRPAADGDGSTVPGMRLRALAHRHGQARRDEEAKKKIYNVSCERYFGFGCEIDEETSNKLEGLPGVLFVLPDSYVDAENKDYGAELFVNGEIVQRSPERQRRVEPVAQRHQDRPRYNDRTRYVRRRDNMR